MIASDQMQRTVAIADAIDQKFIARRAVLRTFADSLEAQQLRGTTQLQPFLLRHPSLLEVFDNVTVHRPHGRGGCQLRRSGQPIGRINVADRPYFIETLTSGKGSFHSRFATAPTALYRC